MNVVYTALFGDASRDTVRVPTRVDPDARYLVFSDLPQSHFPAPYVVMAPLTPPEWEPRKQARWHKVNSCSLLKTLYGKEVRVEPIHSIWHDASFQLTDFPGNILKFLGEAQLAVPRHRDRVCTYAEALECARLKLADPVTLMCQTDRYKKWGLPPDAGMWETGMLLRNSSSWRTTAFESLWWHEINNFTLRDQVSFPYAMLSSHLVIDTLPVITKLPFAIYRSHNGKGKKRT